ncbi:PREDICTED: regulator of nonsense transcripts 3A [Nicrophorus vespilloides]|uniref:Regulator of nonsense transcripts 3A n=1 Tax=Nicrophorus vespilloides TaxID=110193 RepID=A0ABM1N230_NICVS|nr:PREDICTED: regulator of nonsense transcripts 3A [Nicrophorus vespilloides]
MALSETTEKNAASNEGAKDKREKLSTKVIIRRLPPGITQADFLNQVSPAPDYDYIYMVRGDMSLGENAFSRVYINFCNPEDVYLFKDKFDNYVFVDTKGHEYPAVVEYSSFQKVPKRRKARPDPKIASIEADPIYIEFLESLKEQPTNEEKPEFSYQPSTENKNDSTTPLLDFLKQRKMDRMRLREEKREERRKKEIEKKKLKEDDRKKRIEIKQKPAQKETEPSKAKEDSKEEANEKPLEKSPVKNKDKKYEDRKGKKFGKFEDKKEFKNRRDDYYGRNKFDGEKKTDNPPKETVKKIKKYSERREERRNEANKAEHKKEKEADSNKAESENKPKGENAKSEESKHDDKKSDSADGEAGGGGGETSRHKNKDNDPRAQRRIRNKDRPTMAIYKPGMLRKKSVDNDGSKDCEKEKSNPPEQNLEQE